MGYDPDSHHRRSIRLRDFDYSTNGAYYVTICTQGRECLFGEIRDGKISLNEAGRLAASVWHDLPARFPMTSDEFVIMPNHVHGIVMLHDRRGESCIRPPIEGDHKDQGDHKDRPYGTAADSVGRIVQAFKSLTTNAYIHGVNKHNWPPFPGRLWQRNYYERIIRNEQELAAIREYIVANPANWDEDKEKPDFIAAELPIS